MHSRKFRPFPSEVRLNRRRRIFPCLIALLVTATLFIGYAHAAQPAKVAIIPFTINADRDLSFLQKGIADMLGSRFRTAASKLGLHCGDYAHSLDCQQFQRPGQHQLGLDL